MPQVNLMPYGVNQYLDGNSAPLSGGKLYTYQGGTNTDKAVYTDSTGLTAHTNPIILDSEGRCVVWLASGAYRLLLTDANDVTIPGWPIDNVVASTVVASVSSMTELKDVPAGSEAIIQTLGRLSINDGGGWIYYWDASSSAPDDGGMAIQPDSVPAQGRWIGLRPSDGIIPLIAYGAVCDGATSDTGAAINCDAYCSANNYVMFIEKDTYFGTDPGLDCVVKLAPGAMLSWGNFSPVFDIRIDLEDLTQHFSYSGSYHPVLSTKLYRPEWFGETISSCSNTIAAISASSNSGACMVDNELFIQQGSNPFVQAFVGSTQVLAITADGTDTTIDPIGNNLAIDGNLVVNGDIEVDNNIGIAAKADLIVLGAYETDINASFVQFNDPASTGIIGDGGKISFGSKISSVTTATLASIKANKVNATVNNSQSNVEIRTNGVLGYDVPRITTDEESTDIVGEFNILDRWVSGSAGNGGVINLRGYIDDDGDSSTMAVIKAYKKNSTDDNAQARLLLKTYGASGMETQLTISDDGITLDDLTAQGRGTINAYGMNVQDMAEHADNAAAITAGLPIGRFYRTGDIVKVVH
jgi:hypothetical protein